MYGGSSKVARGGGAGGRGGSKRNNSFFPPQRPHRLVAPSSGRLSLGGSGGPSNRNSNPASLPAVEESFSILSGSKPPAFAMIIRLTPDLVDEIKRVEAQGGNARIKFGPKASIVNGNMIDVAGKEFNFTWAHNGDLCDVYEEHQGDEDGEGALVECGCAWRKITVRRFLDESITNQVKKRSEEADRKMKSRKAIILDHGNPPKGQIKALQAAEATPWRSYSKKKESAMKNRKVEPLPVGGHPKSGYKAGLSASNTAKGRSSSSPLSSPPKQRGATSSPFQAVNISKSLDDAVLPNLSIKPSFAASSEKETPSSKNISSLENLGIKGNAGDKPLRQQIMEKPVGMSGKIANYQAPGRYILKPGVDLESVKKPVSGRQRLHHLTPEGLMIDAENMSSSPEDYRHQICISEEINDETPAPVLSFEDKVGNNGLAEQGQENLEIGVVEKSNALEKIDKEQVSPDIFIDKKGSDNSDGQAASSSDSGSDSDGESDSSDSASGSDSSSKSRSRSPVGSGSGSSSDSESDASSNSKQASDEDVDIMTSDDEKEAKNTVESSKQRDYALVSVQTADGINEKENVYEADAIEVEKDLSDNTIEAEKENPYKDPQQLAEQTKSSSPEDNLRTCQSYMGSSFPEHEHIAKGNCRYVSDNCEKMSKGKHKRDSDVKFLNENSGCTKRPKKETSVEMSISGGSTQLFKPSRKVSPPSLVGESAILISNRGDRVINSSSGLQKGYGQAFLGKSSLDLQESGGRNDKGLWPKPAYTLENLEHADDKEHSRKHSEKNLHVNDGLPAKKDNGYRDCLTEDDHAHENKNSRNIRDNSCGSKPLGASLKDPGGVSMDKSVNGRGRILQRELSDLELGEIRTPEDTTVKKQFERKSSFKQLEKKSSTSDVRIPDGMKAKPQMNVTSESRKPSPAFVGRGFQSNFEGCNNTDNHFEDSTRPNSKVGQLHLQQHKLDHHEVSKVTDTSNKFRNNEVELRKGFGSDGDMESLKKVDLHATKQDYKHGTVPHLWKESNRQTSNSMEMADGQKRSFVTDGKNSDQKRRESSSDENSCSYSKYEKNKPELKGSIRNLPQYEEYLQEYHDKYDSYCSLNKILESYRHDFEKLGKELENVKGRDTGAYMRILAQMRDSYRRCGTRHKRLKKIFIVLHEELKSLKQRITEFANSYMKE